MLAVPIIKQFSLPFIFLNFHEHVVGFLLAGKRRSASLPTCAERATGNREIEGPNVGDLIANLTIQLEPAAA